MAQQRISMSEIHLGRPLPWNAYNSHGHLLLKKGMIIETRRKWPPSSNKACLQTLLHRPPTKPTPMPSRTREAPSVLRMIDLAEKRLERLLFGMGSEPDFPARLVEVATSVISAAELNSDIALACILLNQQAGDYPVRHSLDTAVVAILVAQSMNIARDKIVTLTAAALTMNVGMLRQQIQLQRKQEALSGEEIESIHRHPQEGVRMLEAAGVHDAIWLAYVMSHHETEDGGGYPAGLAGKDIPPGAKVLALADRYCACVSERKYRKSQLPGAALREIFLERGKSVDPALAAYFIKVLGIYPPGTLVRLNNGEIGVVTQESRRGHHAHRSCAGRAARRTPVDSRQKRYGQRAVYHQGSAAHGPGRHPLQHAPGLGRRGASLELRYLPKALSGIDMTLLAASCRSTDTAGFAA